MWSGEGGVDEKGEEGPGAQAQRPPEVVSSSTSPSPTAVDLSLKTVLQDSSLLTEEGSEGPAAADSSNQPTSTSAVQTGLREYSSIKEVLLEMTNRKNGHSKLPPAKWGIMKKEADQVLLKVPKYVVEDKKGVFPRPTAFVNPFPADSLPLNGAAIQTSIKDWLNGKKIDVSSREINKPCSIPKPAKVVMKQRVPRGSNGKLVPSKKKPLTTIVAQLTGNVQNTQATSIVASPSTPDSVHELLKPPSESVSFLSSHRLSGGEVSITEVSPDLSVIDRLKRLGTVIEIEEQEKDSLKLLEKMTKSVTVDVDSAPVSKAVRQPSKPSNSRPAPKQQLQAPQDLSKNSPLQLTVPSEMPIITLTNVPSEQSVQQPHQSLELTIKQPLKNQSSQQLIKASNTMKTHLPNQPTPVVNSDLVKSQQTIQSSKGPSSANQSAKAQINNFSSAQSSASPTSQVSITNQGLRVSVLGQNTFNSSSQSPKELPVLISLTPKIQFAQRPKALNTKGAKSKTPMKSKVQPSNTFPLKQQLNIKPSSLPLPSTHLTAPVFLSKDVTLIPKPLPETLQDKIEPSLLEPVIDIVEEENVLAPDGTFLFRTDSFHNVDLPNEQKVFSCDICSAVYTHANMLRKHYLRLHIARKYISEKDMETFNIDPEPSSEKCKDNHIFRCHTCRECFVTKNDLRSHLISHPPVEELVKQNNKTHPIYKCENCSTVFKWRKQFGKHKKLCKSPPPPAVEKSDLYHCLYCNETFSNANGKRNHILSNHPYVRRKHCCVFCKRDGFPTNVSLFHHLLNDHPTVYFACQACKERFTRLEELRSHVDKRHEQDDKLRSSMLERVSALKQEKEFYSCDTCQRKFLIENSFKEHKCFPEKQEKPKLQKIKKKVHTQSERVEKQSHKVVDLETLFFSSVARNVRDNLLNHLDGKIYKEESEDDQSSGGLSPNSSRMFLNFSQSFASSSDVSLDQSGADTPSRARAHWEKYNFPKNYDGRCGLTSYIKDAAYLDLHTQLTMRRNLQQKLNMLPIKSPGTNDVPSAVDLEEKLRAECAESYGTEKKEKTDVGDEEDSDQGVLSGEWVRDRMYVCSACHWETPCLWTMEDHKYLAHPRVHCPQHELVGDQTNLSQTIYKRLIEEEQPPFQGPMPPPPPTLSTLTCTKCGEGGFPNQSDLHIHILECAGVVVEAVGPPSKRRRRRMRRRPRRGLKRNIPQTPQKPPTKQRTKPGDTDTIQRMIANLPAKRISRKVLTTYDQNQARLNAKKNAAAAKSGKNKKSKEPEKASQSEPVTPTKDQEKHILFQKSMSIRKAQDYIDTSAEGGDVLSSLRMMPVRTAKPLEDAPSVVPEVTPSEKKEVQETPTSSVQQEDKEMPTLEIEKDISPVESAEIPVLSPVDSTEKELKKDQEDLICGISFIDGKIKYETVQSVSEETDKIDVTTKKRKSSSNSVVSAPSGPAKKKSRKENIEPDETLKSEIDLVPIKINESKADLSNEDINSDTIVEPDKSSPTLKSASPKPKGKKGNKVSSENNNEKEISSAANDVSIQNVVNSEKLTTKKSPVKRKGKKSGSVSVANVQEEEASLSKEVTKEIVSSASDVLEQDKPTQKVNLSNLKGRRSNRISAVITNEEECTSSSEISTYVFETEKSSAQNSKPTKPRGKKAIKNGIEDITKDNSTVAPSLPIVDPVEPDKLKPRGQKTRGKKSSNIVEDIPIPLSDESNISALDNSVSDTNSETLQQKGKKTVKNSKEIQESVTSITESDPLGGGVSELNQLVTVKSSSQHSKGKKNNKCNVGSVLEGEVVPVSCNITSSLDSGSLPSPESNIPEIQSVTPKVVKGRKSNASLGQKNAGLKKNGKVEKLAVNSTRPLRTKRYFKEIPEPKEPTPPKRGPGRPRNSIKKLQSPETRRSNRRSANGDLSIVKYDEILPCEENEALEIVKKPEKPGRKPRTVKEPPPSDSTTIVVEVEVHPEPILKRKLDETYLKESSNSENDPVSKKIKEDSKEAMGVKELDEEDQICSTVDSQLTENNEKDNSCSIQSPHDESLNCNVQASPKSENPNLDDDKILSAQINVNEGHLKTDQEKKSEAPTTPSKSTTCYNSLTIEGSKKDSCDKAPTPPKIVDVYEFVDYDINEDTTKNSNDVVNSSSDISSKPKEPEQENLVASSNEVTSTEKVLNMDTAAPEPVDTDKSEVSVKNAKSENFVTNSSEDSEVRILNEVSVETIEEQLSTDILVKRKKVVRKVTKAKKKVSKKEDDKVEEIDHLEVANEIMTDDLDVTELEKDKIKKSKKQIKKDSSDLQEVKKLKKEPLELSDSKKLKKLLKKKKVIKKVVKAKKRALSKSQSSSKVLNIAGFTWEVSELEAPPMVDSYTSELLQPAPDSSVGEPLIEQEVPAIQLSQSTQESVEPLPSSVPILSGVPPPSAPPAMPQALPPAQSTTITKSPHPTAILPLASSLSSVTPLVLSTALPPSGPLPSTPPSTLQSWEGPTPWEPPPTDTSIGTIIDSVNKLLNEPESTFTPLGLPSYSLADLQKAMGASDAEMAVLQQLGEASLQISSTDGSCSGSMKSEPDDWNGEKCIMDLDSHTPLQKVPPPRPLSPAALPLPDLESSPDPNTLIKEEEWRWREKSPDSPVGGSSSLLEAHQGKEVLCPSCSCHFMGFPALQKHLAKAHPTIDPKSKQKRGAGTPFTKTDLNRRMPLDCSKGPRLICFTCQQILPSDRMGLHLDQEHDIAPEEVTKCSSISGETHDGPVIGERLKSKMSLKLGDLLDRAVNNLLQAKHKPNNTLSGGAVELLTKLCAVRKREGSVKHRLHGARELLSKLQRQQEMKSEEAVEEVKVVKKLFSCSICGLKFSLPSSRNKHEVLAHRSYRPVEHELDEYENDWREAPSPPEAPGENGESAINPQCSDCGLSFDSIQEMMRHRVEDHTARRSSVDTVNTTGTGCCPSPVPSSGGSRSQPDSEGEVAGTDSDAGSGAGKLRGNKFRKHGLSHNGSRLVKERAEAALRELNHPRQRPGDRHRWAIKQRAAEVYNFTEDSL